MTGRSVPGPAQKRLLQYVQDTAKQAADMLSDLRFQLEFVDLPPQSWFVAFQQLQDLGRDLYGMGEEAGVPTSWIAHARDKGERGISWRENYQGWPTPEPGDRDAVVDLLAQRARALRELVVAAVSRDSATGGRLSNDAERHQISAERDRLAGLVALADLDAAERERVWPAQQGWASATAAQLHSGDVQALTVRWREFHSDPARAEAIWQAELFRVLESLGAQAILAPPSSAELLDAARTAVRSLGYPTKHLNHATSAGESVPAGSGIDDAVTTALPADGGGAATGSLERSAPAEAPGQSASYAVGLEL